MLCRGYEYTSVTQKLKVFLVTLKGAALRWFMRLGVGTIQTWNDMREAFLFKYQDYCRTMDLKEEIFKIAQKEEESLEDYMERFHYNLQRSKFINLDPEILKQIYLRGMRDDYLEHFNLLGKGYISQEPLEEIIKLYLWISRGLVKWTSSIRDPLV